MEFVQFDDSGLIISVFPSEQDPAVWPGVVQIDGGDPRYLEYLAAASTSLESIALTTRDGLLAFATLRISPYQDAVDLGDATDSDLVYLNEWKRYRIALNRITDQVGFPEKIEWPPTPVDL